MREARRLALIERQRLIAEVARKQALRALAEALETEARHTAIAARTRALVSASAPGEGPTTGAALAGWAGFTAGLARIAVQADEAAQDAARQRVWQADSLVAAETRAKRLAEREAEARGALDALRERREAARSVPLARKLQSRGDT
jgi:hypothetical protein